MQFIIWDGQPDCCSRNIDKKHVESLKEIFQASLGRTSLGHHMKATLSKDDWNALTHFLAASVASKSFNGPCTNKDALRKHVLKAVTILHLGSQKTVIAPFPVPVEPILEAGQHRKEALLGMVNKQNALATSSPTQIAAVSKILIWDDIPLDITHDLFYRQPPMASHIIFLGAWTC